MTPPRMLRVVVAKTHSYDGDWPDDSLVNFAEWLQRRIEAIPVQYRPTARIEFESDYESYDTTLEISFIRPETLEEAQAAEEASRRSVAEHQRRQEESERKTLALLTEKYGRVQP